ncbi:hypothetical protein [Wenyingzhuangia sp. 2_MG-2023]|uniref:hypothetical protein n=1 Tax=Wenyingzhuangia sp. 2_MG-2023 TaxID=3062639 RepID=UPI0026E2CE68|nr:hypothetical protein [Wenyingzhuangia sp. 2_MG-2023]MDO6737982.1 hypothetical protein [Wenyingzhuangia sp. 2_MG-2023]MDO6802664.1 hypothetical protein [Wenyingzhuangia sp. 1_MG-2023]
MNFIIAIISAILAGWIASLLFRSIKLELGPVVYFFLGLIGGIFTGLIVKIFKIPFINGYLGDFILDVTGAIILLFIFSLIPKKEQTEEE